jgi:hypothetical protein
MSLESAKVVSIIQAAENSDSECDISKASVSEVLSDRADAGVIITRNGEQCLVRVAFSCLVEPQAGDIVLLAEDISGENYILSVLERPGSKQMLLNFPGDTTLQSKAGSLKFVAEASVDVSANKASISSNVSFLKSKSLTASIGEAYLSGSDVKVNFDAITVVSNLLTTMAKTAIHKFTHYIRSSEQSDRVQAGQMSRDVKGMYSMDSKYTIMVSKKDTKIDGERIHMG